MNPANVKFCCTGDCGVNGIGTASAGVEHWSTLNSTAPTVATSPGGRGTRAYKCTAQGFFTHTFATQIASPATLVYRHYVYFETALPNADCAYSGEGLTGNGFGFKVSDGTIRAVTSFTNFGASGVAISPDTWYCIDVKVVSDTTRTSDVTVTPLGGTPTACAQASEASAAQQSTGIRLGAQTAGVTQTVYFRDLICSGTAGDYPIGPGQGVALFPNADRTNSSATPTDGNKGHLYSATTDFGKGSGGATATGAQNAESTSWQSLANPMSTSIATNFIADLLGASTEHMVWELQDLVDALSINGVMLACATHSASATTNAFAAGIGNASALKAASISGDLSESTITIPVAVVTTDASAAAWDPTKVNATTIWFGDSTDVNPDVFLDSACLEVDFVPVVPQPPKASPYPQMIGR